jgi:hypothetical protein
MPELGRAGFFQCLTFQSLARFQLARCFSKITRGDDVVTINSRIVLPPRWKIRPQSVTVSPTFSARAALRRAINPASSPSHGIVRPSPFLAFLPAKTITSPSISSQRSDAISPLRMPVCHPNSATSASPSASIANGQQEPIPRMMPIPVFTPLGHSVENFRAIRLCHLPLYSKCVSK